LKKLFLLPFVAILFLTLINCSVIDDAQDTLDSLQCIQLVEELDTDVDNNRPCSEIQSDINDILSGSCRQFLDSEQIMQLEFARDNCSDN